MKIINIVVNGEVGHRREFISLFTNFIMRNGRRVSVGTLGFSKVFSKTVLFSPMLEEHTLGFLGAATLRAIFGLKSVALIFRPKQCIHYETYGQFFKHIVLRILRPFGGIRIISILPVDIEPRLNRIADDWIYDPQLWDLGIDGSMDESDLSRSVVVASNGRKIILSLGSQSKDKGFDYLVELWLSSKEIQKRYLFVACGGLDPMSGATAEKFTKAGGYLSDRYLTDEEIRSLYLISNLVWCCYSPNYDQASGIFGRSFQLGVPALVRQGSYIERLGAMIGHEGLSMPWKDCRSSAELLLSYSPAAFDPLKRAEKCRSMREVSLGRVGKALMFSNVVTK